MNFRCTKKAQVRLRLTPSGLAPVPDTVSTVDWHCNVVTLGKRPFFLFAHSQSLYAFFVAAAGNSPLDAFGRAFRDQLAAALVREGVAATLGARLMDDGPDTICRNGDWVSRRSSGWLGTDGALAQGGDSRQQKDTRRKSTSRTGRICYHDVIW